jgi:DNA-binding LytR/AlgR family response regulator
LLKPVRAEELERVLTKVERLRPGGAGREVAERLARLESALRGPEPSPGRVASRVGSSIQLVELGRITHFTAEDKLTCAVTPERSYVVDAPIAQLEDKLAGFCRIHRATLVNLSFVGEVGAVDGGAFVRLTDPQRTRLAVARDRVRALKARLGI